MPKSDSPIIAYLQEMTLLSMDHTSLLIKFCKVEPTCMQFAPPVPNVHPWSPIPDDRLQSYSLV